MRCAVGFITITAHLEVDMIIIFIPMLQVRKWDTETSGNLPKVTQARRGRGTKHKQVSCRAHVRNACENRNGRTLMGKTKVDDPIYAPQQFLRHLQRPYTSPDHAENTSFPRILPSVDPTHGSQISLGWGPLGGKGQGLICPPLPLNCSSTGAYQTPLQTAWKVLGHFFPGAQSQLEEIKALKRKRKMSLLVLIKAPGLPSSSPVWSFSKQSP